MYPVTQAYNEQMELAVRNKSWIRITFGVTDPDAPAASTITDNGHLSYSNTSGIVVGATSPATYATLEHNRWVLDGKQPIPVSSNPIYQGYVGSAISGSDCLWGTNPQLTCVFNDYFQFAGLSFYFDESMEEYPVKFQVDIYKDNVLQYSSVELCTKAYWVLDYHIPICNKLVFTWLESNRPYRRARLTSLIFGILEELTEQDIESCSVEKQTELLSTSFPKNSFEFTIFDTEKSYDPENPAGVWEYLESRQPVDVRIGYSLEDGTIEWIPWIHSYSTGDFSISGSDAVTLVSIKCAGLMEHMSMQYDSGKFYPNGRSLYDLVYDVINDAGFRNVVEVDDVLKTIMTRVPLPTGQVNTLLQLIANAGHCIMNYSRGGVLQIYRDTTNKTDFDMNFGKMTEKPETTKIAPLRYLSTQYHPVSVSNDTTTVVNEQEVEVANSKRVYKLTNLITNGSFENGVDGWVANRTTLTQLKNTGYYGLYSMQIVSNVANTWTNAAINLLDRVNTTHKYYLMCYGICTVNTNNSLWGGEMQVHTSAGWQYHQIYPNSTSFQSENNQWLRGSHYINYLNSNTDTLKFLPFQFRNTIAIGGTGCVDGVLLVDLTEAFGAGNEPDKAWCDEHLDYFDDSVNMSMDSYIVHNKTTWGDMVDTSNIAMFVYNGTPYTYSLTTGIGHCGHTIAMPCATSGYGTHMYTDENTFQYKENTLTFAPKLPHTNGHKYYISANIYIHSDYSDKTVRNSFQIYPFVESDAPDSSQTTVTFNTDNECKHFSNIVTDGSTTGISRLRFDNNILSQSAGRQWIGLSDLILVDLTEAFGAGNEPSQEWCDEHLSTFFDTKVVQMDMTEITFNHNACVNQVVSVSDGLIMGEAKNYAYKTVVPLYGSGKVTINANELKFGDIEYTKKYGDVGEDLTEMDNQLVDNYTDCAAYADWLASVTQRRNSYSAPDRGYPQLDIGDKINFKSNFQNNITVTMTKQKITFNGAINGEGSYVIGGDE